MKEQKFRYHPEQRQLPPKVYEGEILPPLPRPKPVMQDEAARIEIIRMELNSYTREAPKQPPQVIFVEKHTPQPETVWDELGMAVGEGIAGVRGFIGEMMPLWRGIRRL